VAALAVSTDAVAIAEWESTTVSIVDLPALQTVRCTCDASTAAAASAAPRDVAFASEGHIVVALADGLVVVFAPSGSNDNPPQCAAKRAVSLGTRPPKLAVVGGDVLAVADRACLVSVRAAAGTPANVECRSVHMDDYGIAVEDDEPGRGRPSDDADDFWGSSCVAPVASASSSRRLVLAAGGRLLLCDVDGDRRLRAREVPLGEQPRCVCLYPRPAFARRQKSRQTCRPLRPPRVGAALRGGHRAGLGL
jgi:hypothetical protein